MYSPCRCCQRISSKSARLCTSTGNPHCVTESAEVVCKSSICCKKRREVPPRMRSHNEPSASAYTLKPKCRLGLFAKAQNWTVKRTVPVYDIWCSLRHDTKRNNIGPVFRHHFGNAVWLYEATQVHTAQNVIPGLISTMKANDYLFHSHYFW